MEDINLLDTEKLLEIPYGLIFAHGIVRNEPEGVYMTNTRQGDNLLWIAKRGGGPKDWAIYIHWEESGLEFVSTQGDKVTNAENIQKLVPCTKEVLSYYRL